MYICITHMFNIWENIWFLRCYIYIFKETPNQEIEYSSASTETVEDRFRNQHTFWCLCTTIAQTLSGWKTHHVFMAFQRASQAAGPSIMEVRRWWISSRWHHEEDTWCNARAIVTYLFARCWGRAGEATGGTSRGNSSTRSGMTKSKEHACYM